MKNIFLKLLLCNLVFFALSGYAQTAHITGTVLDENKEAMPGVNVMIKGTTTGTITDLDGKFAINASKKSIISISFTGYKTQNINVGDKTNIIVTLLEDAQLIDEVVIVGFGSQKKENLTGAVKSVDVKVLESRPIANAVSGLQGAVAGLNITNDNGGAPGQKMNMNIRGAGSIGDGSNASTLVLIDGIEGDLSLVNPNDIENISVLKDAAAASIYGSRAPFGAILVTTKQGTKGLSVKYSGNVRLQNPLNTPHMLDSYKHALVSNQASHNTGGGDLFPQGMIDKILAYQQGRKIYDKDGKDTHVEWGTGPRDVQGTDEWEWESGTWANTNWYDVYLKDISYSQEHNVTLDGGTDKLTYFVSGRYFKQNGLYNFMKDEYRTMNLNGTFNFKITDRINFSWNTRFVDELTDKPSALTDLFFRNLSKLFPTTPLTMPNGDYNQFSFVPAMQDGGQQITSNRLIYNQMKLTIEPVKGWKVYADFGSRIENPTYTRQFNPLKVVLPSGKITYASPMKGMSSGKIEVDKDGNFIIEPTGDDTWYEETNGRVNYYNYSIRTDYEKKIGDHYFKVLLGTQTEYYKNESLRLGSNKILLTETPIIPQDKSATVLHTNYRGDWITLGFFGRINYSWADRYLFEANIRRDGASRFPSNKRWGIFPSFSVGWNIAQEGFFNNLREKGFDMLKLRGSFGSLGNQNTNSFYPYYQKIYVADAAYIINDKRAQTILAPDPFTSNITWETIQTTDIGIDIALLSNRLSASFDWYERMTKNMVGPAIAIPNVYGAPVPKTNNAELRTRGWEFEIVWRDRINKDWSYEVSGSLSDYSDIITKYKSPDNALKSYYVGKNLGDIYGYRVHGIAKNDNEMNEWIKNGHDQSSISKVWGGGDFMYEDLDGDGKITEGANTLDNKGDLSIIGNSTPRFQYSFRGSFTWRWLDFSIFWQGIGKRDVYFTSSTFDGMGDAYDRPMAEEHMDYFRYADNSFGENLNAYYARPRIDDANNKVNDYYLQNGAYLRLKNVTLGYTLPKNTKANKVIKNLRIYISGENLLTISSLRVFDPEAIGLTTATWGNGLTYPMFRTFSAGLTITL